MHEPQDRSPHHAEVAHHIPGRIRLRLRRKSRQPHVLHRLKTKLGSQSGIHQIEGSEAAGSITIHYDAEQHTKTGILGLLEDIGVVVGTVMDVPHLEGLDEEKGHSKAALTLTGALNDLNRRLSVLTGNAFDLRVLFPLSLIGLGFWQIRKQGLMLE